MKASGFKTSVLLLFIIQSLMLLSCGDDDLKNATAVSSKKITLTKDRSYGVQVTYSDSAKVKAKGFAAVLDKVTPSQGAVYSEMPKGVNIEFFNEFLVRTGTIRSDYAINKETEKITIFRKNVVVVSDKITFVTEELIWDENKKMYFSPFGTVTAKDGSVITGKKFSAPQAFSTYNIAEPSGTAYIKGDLTQ